MTANFTCQRQLAKHDVDRTENIGPVDLDSFFSEFHKIDWELECDRCKWVNKAWPGISVTNAENDTTLWVSAHRPNPHALVKEFMSNAEMALWFVIGLNSNTNYLADELTYQVKTIDDYFDREFTTWKTEEIEKAFRLFFSKHYLDLRTCLLQMKEIVSEP